MRKLKLRSILLSATTFALGLTALNIDSSEASVTYKPASTVEIISTEMNHHNTSELPTTERPTTEEKSIERPTVEQSTETHPTQSPETTEPITQPTEELPTTETVKTSELPQTTEPSVVIPNTPDTPTTERPSVSPVTPPVSSLNPVTTEQPVVTAPPVDKDHQTPVTTEPVGQSDSEPPADKTHKPTKFCPQDSASYYLALDKHVGELVTAKLEKNSHPSVIAKKTQSTTSDLAVAAEEIEAPSIEEKEVRSGNESNKAVNHLNQLPDTGEITSFIGYMLVFLLTGVYLLRRH
ncbi:hypothetical protein [Macrococcoides caseolyticum]|uniref:hypothetical protein n=1 Tax=Macrococcoides caseolyticum TaxID=69966 RepID=UPI001F1BEE69|nr:hypothetical protein [Macrococcus caseolyticus]MCE4958022.1 hypothetical protein [Macrococcus caseolyticus]